MTRYLLDTCICVFLFRQKYNVAEKLSKLDPSQCYVSEVTIAELTYGAYKSNKIYCCPLKTKKSPIMCPQCP